MERFAEYIKKRIQSEIDRYTNDIEHWKDFPYQEDIKHEQNARRNKIRGLRTAISIIDECLKDIEFQENFDSFIVESKDLLNKMETIIVNDRKAKKI